MTDTKALCWVGWSDDEGLWRCVREAGHDGDHDYKKPSEFNLATRTMTIRHSNGDIVEFKPHEHLWFKHED